MSQANGTALPSLHECRLSTTTCGGGFGWFGRPLLAALAAFAEVFREATP